MTTIYEALSVVMKEVGAVKKGDQNTQQGFSFRGVDAVTSAVYPALIKNGVVVAPKILSYDYGSVEVGRNRTPMGHARLTVEFTWYGPEGDSIVSVVAAESMDSGDKATAKAHSVAFRTALLQTLCLPTDEPDPDTHSYERSEQVSPEEKEHAAAIEDLGDTCAALGLVPGETAGKFYALHKKPVRAATTAQIREFVASLHDEAEKAKAADQKIEETA